MEERKFNEEFGLRVKSRREELGLTQGELARKIGYRNRSTISMIESGERTVSGKLYDWLKIRLSEPFCKQCVYCSQLTGCHIIAHKNRDRHPHFDGPSIYRILKNSDHR